MRIIYYKTGSGREPVKEYFTKLNVIDQAKIAEDLEIIKDCNSLDDLKISPVILKHLLDFQMVLLHACKKQSQKADTRDIEIGMKRMKEVLS
jgi:phage-related protein